MLAGALLTGACSKVAQTDTVPDNGTKAINTDLDGRPVTVELGTSGEYSESCHCCIFTSNDRINCQEITVICHEIVRVPGINSFLALDGGSASDVAAYFNSNAWEEWIPDLDETALVGLRSGSYTIQLHTDTLGIAVYQAVNKNDATDVLYSFCFDIDEH